MGGSYGSGTYLVMLLVGVAIVLVDGQVILRHGPGYLVEAYGDPRRARQVAGLVTVLFHLVMLGVVLLVISGLDPNPTVPAVLRRLGTMLILTAIGHAVTIAILSRLREQQTGTDLANAQMDATSAPTREPLAGEPGVAVTPAESVPPQTPAPATTRRGRATKLGRAVRPR